MPTRPKLETDRDGLQLGRTPILFTCRTARSRPPLRRQPEEPPPRDQPRNDLLQVGVVDEVHLLVGPATIGGGVSAFRDGTAARLRLADHRRLDGSNLVLLSYAVEGAEPD